MLIHTTEARFRVLLLDYQVLVRAALRALLEYHLPGALIAEAVPGVAAVRVVATSQPHIIVLNPWPPASTLALIPDLLAAAEQARLLVLADPHDAELPYHAIRQGAMGIIWDQSPAMLVRAMTKVYAGELWADRQVLAQVLTDLVQGVPPGELDPDSSKIRQLTAREHEVLRLFVTGCRPVQIAQQLSIAEPTVLQHLRSMFRKLGVCNRIELIIYAYRHGLVPPPG